jgi:predicted enzyme related to lactoylglutathione lyase
MAELYGPGHFGWNELLTSDVSSATKFYTELRDGKTNWTIG